jgi:hypothetical protein
MSESVSVVRSIIPGPWRASEDAEGRVAHHKVIGGDDDGTVVIRSAETSE